MRWPTYRDVLAEARKGRIQESYLPEYLEGGRKFYDHGCLRQDGTIVINPVHGIVDTLVHECLHRMRPQWSERAVRRMTRMLMRRMTEGELKALYRAYQREVGR